jgi:peptide deformylase
MPTLPIRIWGDPILKKRAAAVDRLSTQDKKLIEDMIETMLESDGAGLAAPQVGVLKRIFVFRRGEDIHVLVNPKIIKREGRKTGDEGCLSIPGVQAKVVRSRKVLIAGRDQNNKPVEYECEDGEDQGRAATCVQHELDHLDGVLYLEKAVPDSISWLLEEVDEDGEEIIALEETSPEEILRAYKTKRLPKNLHIQPHLKERVLKSQK